MGFLIVDDFFNKEPHEVVDGVPVFVQRSDSYIKNYEKISQDHLLSVDHGHGNPFMDEGVWRDIEANTLSMIRKYVSDGARILDVGVGTGRVLANFPGLYCHGVDVSLDYLRRLTSSKIKVALANLEDLPYKEGLFDALVCTDVLEHVLDLYRAGLEIRRVLKPGGTLVVRVPYREDLAPYLADSYPYALAHVRSFDEHQLDIFFVKVLGFSKSDTVYDKCFSPERLAWPRVFGRGPINRLLRLAASHVPFLKSLLLRAYKPMEITVVYCKS